MIYVAIGYAVVSVVTFACEMAVLKQIGEAITAKWIALRIVSALLWPLSIPVGTYRLAKYDKERTNNSGR